jgi:hypothetical protein
VVGIKTRIYKFKEKGKNSLFLGLLLLASLTSPMTFDKIKMSYLLYNTLNFFVKGQHFILIGDYFNLPKVSNNNHEKGLT